MRGQLIVILLCVLFSCDSTRVYEQQIDFKEKYWLVTEKPGFEFEIKDHTQNYNIYCTVRNSLDFPFSRLFVTYILQDSSNNQLQKDLVNTYLFDQKTGRPNGSSGLGDLFDHRIELLRNYHFERPGHYSINLEQFNRRDTLQGILAVGLRVELANQNK